MNDWTPITINDLNKSQQRGAIKIIDEMNDRARRMEKYNPALNVEILTTDGLVSIIARIELHGLGKGNLLRYIEEGEYFHAFIGKRGAVNAVTYPKSCDQFKGRRTFSGINFK